LFFKANDQHPPHDVALGEYLIADVYEALRASPQWEHSLLVILSDEHGGIYDHMPPPMAINPDGKRSTKPRFGFDRLGVRIPAVIVSPYIPAGTIDSRVYDHTSVLATVEKRFQLAPLTKRDAAAHTFDGNLRLASPRTDTPRTLLRPTDPITAAAYKRMQVALAALTPDVVRAVISSREFAQAAASDLQLSLVKLTKNLPISGEDVMTTVLRLSEWADTEHDAAQLLHLFSSRFFSNVFAPAVTRDLDVAARDLDSEADTLARAARDLAESVPRRERKRTAPPPTPRKAGAGGAAPARKGAARTKAGGGNAKGHKPARS
jgi:hypothetical protein